MDKLLIIGAGRSASSLIKYMLQKASENNWKIIVADVNLALAQSKIGDHPKAEARKLDIFNIDKRRELVKEVDIVASLLPAHLHIEVARDCVQFNKHLITASYVSSEMEELGKQAREKGLTFMGEMGLDPGIDHMSAMQMIHEVREKGGEIKSFKSYTGGLVAPESDDNPWHYKVTWNPRNVVLAGQGTAQYIEDRTLKYVPYHNLFGRYEKINISSVGEFEMYPNRDSLLYRKAYGLEDIPTLLRGTLRGKGYCDAWNAIIKIGLTDDTFPIVHSDQLTYRQLLEAYADDHYGGDLEDKISLQIGERKDSEIMDKLRWLGLFEDEKINLKNATPAQILEQLIVKKWKLKPEDKDMVIMHHELEYDIAGEHRVTKSTMIMKGIDANQTAMSSLVGLPIGILVSHIMKDGLQVTESQIPTIKKVYRPILKELEAFGVTFIEKDELLS